MTEEALGAILLLLSKVSGTPYIPGGNSPAGTDCSGLAAWVANVAVGRNPYSGRFSTAEEGDELAERGFIPGSAPSALNIAWNAGHTAVTLPDGTAVSAGEGNGSGVRVGGGGADQAQFTQHMYLPPTFGAPASGMHDIAWSPPTSDAEPATFHDAGDWSAPAPDAAPAPDELPAPDPAPAPDALPDAAPDAPTHQ